VNIKKPSIPNAEPQLLDGYNKIDGKPLVLMGGTEASCAA
jgi:hypothetical protein